MADERVRILLEAKDNASATINKVGASLDNMQPTVGGLSGSFGKLLPVMGAIGGAFAMVGGASAAMDLASAGAKAEALGASFDMMATAAGQSSEEMLAAMQRASGGTIANTDLILAANRAMSFGVANSGQEMASLIQLSMAQAAKMGISATQAFNDLVTGVGRLSPMILDNLGVTVSAEKAYATYAETLGKTADQLSQAEQRQAFLNEMMASAPNAAKEAEAAADSSAGAFARMESGIKNLTDALGIALAGPMSAFADTAGNIANATAALFDPTSAQEMNTAIENQIGKVQSLQALMAQTEAQMASVGGSAGFEALPEDVQRSLDFGPQLLAIKEYRMELEASVSALARMVQAKGMIGEQSNFQSGQDQAAQWMAAQAALLEQTRANVASIISEADAAQAAMIQTYTAQIDSLTKGLISDVGAGAALEMNDRLKGQLLELIGIYQALGMSSQEINYSLIDWLNGQVGAARDAANSLNNYARSAANAGANSAGAIGPLRGLAGALRDVAMSGGGPNRMDKWEKINYDLTGITPKAYALKDGFAALGETFDTFSYSAGGAASSLEGFDALDGIGSKVQGLLSGALDVGVGPDPSSLLPREDALNEDARRLADVMVNGFSSPWAAYFQSEFPALFQQMTAGGDIKAGAATMLQEFEQGLRPELINQDMVKERVKAMLVGDANMAALAQEITAELQAEMAGMDPAQISAAVGGALGIGDTGVSSGIEDELGNAALIGKIQGTGTTAGKSWGNAFLAYVQDNVPATLVGLLVDLVTPGVRAKINAEGSAEGAL